MENWWKLLIVDDDLSDQVLMRGAVKKAGLDIEINTARDGEEGLKKVHALKPDLIVVLDTSMPGMDGFEACRKIKAMDDRCKVIICSGAVDAAHAAQAREAGADDYCAKTSDYAALMQAIRNLTI